MHVGPPLYLFLHSVLLRTALIHSVPLPFAPFRWKHFGVEHVIIEMHLYACGASLVSRFAFCSAPHRSDPLRSAPLCSFPLKTFWSWTCNYWDAPLCMWGLPCISFCVLFCSVPLPFAPFHWKHFGVEDVIIERHLYACGSIILKAMLAKICIRAFHFYPLFLFWLTY
jgi:hypothetical protein